MKNDFCDLKQEDINKLPDRFKGFLLSPFQFNRHNGYVMVPEDAFKEMIDIIAEYAECADEIERLDNERRYWLESAAGYAQELSGLKNDYQHPLKINGVALDELEDAVKNGYQTSTATQLDMIILVRRIMTPNAK